MSCSMQYSEICISSASLLFLNVSIVVDGTGKQKKNK